MGKAVAAAERVPTMMQLHLLMECHRIGELVEELAQEVLTALHISPARRDLRAQAMGAVERVLRKYVVGFDLCGFNPSCHEGKAYDPWTLMREEEISWAGD